MSSDQQLNFHTSVPDTDLCPNKQSDAPKDNQQCGSDDVITAKIILENETLSSTESIRKHDDESVRNESDELATDFHPNDQGTLLDVSENEKNIPEAAKSDENIQSETNCDDASGHDNGNREVVSDNLHNQNGYTTPPLNDELTPEAANPVDLQISNGAAPQTTILDQSNDRNAFEEKQSLNLPSSTANEDTIPCSQQENNDKTTAVVENVTCNTKDQLPESTCASKVNDEEVEHNDDVSEDENEDFFNENDSNEDSSEFPDITDFDGTNEVENEEYILDTVVRKPRSKERRRIVSVNDDDSDADIEVQRELLLQSPTVDKTELVDTSSNDDEEEDIEQLIQNEKPGPKSRKISTQKLKELQTRELLRNAVVIPSSSKKKKNRIIDSDDDEENASLLPYCVDVDDIGLPDTTDDIDNENDALGTSSILLSDIEIPHSSSVENLSQIESAVVSNSAENAIRTELKDEIPPIKSPSTTDIDIKCSVGSLEESPSQQPLDAVHVKEEQCDATRNETTALCDSVNGTDNANKECKKEDESDTIAANFVDFASFPSSSSSDNEDEFIPNDVYFGTPDNNKKKKSSRGKSSGHARGRSTQSSHREVKPIRSTDESRRTGRGVRPSRSDKFIDNRRYSSPSASSSSESEDEYQKSKARRKPETITIVKEPMQLYHKNVLPIRPVQAQQMQQIQQKNRQRKNDRFYDKSQDIPNSIYFGDVDVPLHVLHAFGDSDSDNDANSKNIRPRIDTSIGLSSQVSRGRGRAIAPLPNRSGQTHAKQHQLTTKSYPYSRKAQGRPKVQSVSPSSDRSIQMMKTFLKAAGLKKVKLNRLWEGCKSNSERAEKMLELLREKGLEGEPTISKCKQLKVDYLTKKEIEDLDPNLIIPAEGRTRRSTRAATKRQYTYDEDEILETRTKLRKVVDSDSDFE